MTPGFGIYTCSTCAWFARGDYRTYVHNGANSYLPGTCNIRAPGENGHPPTRSTSSCGEHSQIVPTPRARVAVTETMVEVSAICMSDAWHEGEIAWADLNENVKTTFRTMARDSLTAALALVDSPAPLANGGGEVNGDD